jgi:hypothetical protein
MNDEARQEKASLSRFLVRASPFVLVLLAGWGALEWWFLYSWPDFPSARTPSLRLELADFIGIQNFHGQFGQDKWILGDVHAGVTDGYFVDVGAWAAVRGSNTKALEEAGWNGICVEPFPQGNWGTRKARLFREVLYNEMGKSIEFRTARELGGIDKHLEAWKGKVEEAGLVTLTTTTIGDVLQRAEAPRYIHYLSIDTEGSEYEILKVFPFAEYKVGALTVEHNREEPKRRLIRELLEGNGYRFVRQQVVEDWYVLAD